MKAAYIGGFCAASGIRYGDLPDPVPDTHLSDQTIGRITLQP